MNLAFFLTFLPPLGLSSSQVEVEMLHSAVVKGAALPVCKTSSRAVLPCLGGPITSIFSSLKCSAFRSWARRRAKTEVEPYKKKNKKQMCQMCSNLKLNTVRKQLLQNVMSYSMHFIALFHCSDDKWFWAVLPCDFVCKWGIVSVWSSRV